MQWRRCAARWRPPASEIRIGLCCSTVEPRRGLTVDELKGYTAASWGEGRSGAEAVRASLHEQAPQRAEAEHHDSGDGGSRQDTALLGGEAQRREGVRARVNQGRCGDSLRMRRAGRERCEGDEAPQRTDGSGKARGARPVRRGCERGAARASVRQDRAAHEDVGAVRHRGYRVEEWALAHRYCGEARERARHEGRWRVYRRA